MSRFTRGFTGRGRAPDVQLPPGQYDTGRSWPVLTAEPTPRIDIADWTFAIEGLVAQSTAWIWDEMLALPQSTYDGAIHCVTTWSKFDMHWRGVSLDTLFEIASPLPNASHVLAYSSTGYTTNLPLADVTGGKAWVAFEVDGAPLSRDHGGRHVCSFRTSTSGRAPSSSPASPSSTTTNPASGRSAATTTAATPGSNSDTKGIDW